jgi:hypothetical protein
VSARARARQKLQRAAGDGRRAHPRADRSVGQDGRDAHVVVGVEAVVADEGVQVARGDDRLVAEAPHGVVGAALPRRNVAPHRRRGVGRHLLTEAVHAEGLTAARQVHPPRVGEHDVVDDAKHEGSALAPRAEGAVGLLVAHEQRGLAVEAVELTAEEVPTPAEDGPVAVVGPARKLRRAVGKHPGAHPPREHDGIARHVGLDVDPARRRRVLAVLGQKARGTLERHAGPRPAAAVAHAAVYRRVARRAAVARVVTTRALVAATRKGHRGAEPHHRRDTHGRAYYHPDVACDSPLWHRVQMGRGDA